MRHPGSHGRSRRAAAARDRWWRVVGVAAGLHATSQLGDPMEESSQCSERWHRFQRVGSSGEQVDGPEFDAGHVHERCGSVIERPDDLRRRPVRDVGESSRRDDREVGQDSRIGWLRVGGDGDHRGRAPAVAAGPSEPHLAGREWLAVVAHRLGQSDDPERAMGPDRDGPPWQAPALEPASRPGTGTAAGIPLHRLANGSQGGGTGSNRVGAATKGRGRSCWAVMGSCSRTGRMGASRGSRMCRGSRT
jgi:hypothetical protein